MALGQSLNPGPDSTLRDIKSLRDSIRAVDEEIELLQHFLEASTVDPTFVQYTTIKSWVINNPVLRDSLFYALLQADSSLQSEAGADAEVLATPWNDMIQVRFGTAVFKGMTLKKALDRSADPTLYKKIAESYRYSKDIELRDPSFRLETPLQPELLSPNRILENFFPLSPAGRGERASGFAELAIDRFAVRFGSKWGGEIRLGVDEINNPFWANGTIAFLAAYKRYRFGFVLPFSAGKTSVDVFPPIFFRARNVTGARGFLGDFDFGSIGGLLSVTRFSVNDVGKATNPGNFYYLSGILNLYYSFAVAMDPTDIVRAKVGFGVHRVTAAGLTPIPGDTSNTYVSLGELTNVISPYLRIEYLNKEISDRYAASVQFYNMTLMFAGSMEIVPNILSLEVKYVWPIAGDLKGWEYPDFFVISPKLRIEF